MGSCCGKKPRENIKQGKTVEQKYYETTTKLEEFEEKINQRSKQQEIILECKTPEIINKKYKYSFDDMDLIKGSQMLSDKEKRNLYRAFLILDSKELQIIEVITTVTYGFIMNIVNSNGKVVCMKAIFHDEDLFPSGGDKNKIMRLFNKEIEVIKRLNDKRVVKYKKHFFDDGSSLDNPSLKEIGNVQTLFVEFEDSIQSTFQEYLNKNRGKLNNRQFLQKCQDLILGLDHLHQQKCVTRSLRPDKILISDDKIQRLKFCDFCDYNIQESDKLRTYTLDILQQNEKLQSPQIQYYLKEDKQKINTNEKNDIWIIGAILSQLADIDQNKFDIFSSPSQNQGYVRDNQREKLQYQKSLLLQNITLDTLKFQSLKNNFSAEPQKHILASPHDAHFNYFPRSNKINDDCNILLEQILELDENERQIHKIRGYVDFLAIKYHLDRIQPRLESEYIKGKRVDKAPDQSKMSQLEEQIQSKPQNADAHAKLASCFFEYNKQNNNRALQLIRKAIELQPYNARYYNTLGGILEGENLIEQAEEAYMTSIEIDPSYSLPYHNLGRLNQKVLFRLQQALENYKQAYELDNTNLSSLFNMALLLKEQNCPVEALKYYEICIKRNPDDSQILNNIGVLYYQYPELRDQSNLAQTDPEMYFQKAITNNPNDIFALINKIQVQIKNEFGYEYNEEEINQNLQHAELLNPYHAYTQYIKGIVEMSKPDPNWQSAIEFFKKALQLNPSFSLAAYQIGLIYYEVEKDNSNLTEAIQLFERATIYDSNNFLAFYSLALAQEELLKKTINQTEEYRLKNKIITNYRRAIEINPNYPEALNNLGIMIKQIALKEGKFKKNTREYEIVEIYLREAESIAPNNKIIIDNLQKLYLESNEDDLTQQSNIKSTLVGCM